MGSPEILLRDQNLEIPHLAMTAGQVIENATHAQFQDLEQFLLDPEGNAKNDCLRLSGDAEATAENPFTPSAFLNLADVPDADASAVSAALSLHEHMDLDEDVTLCFPPFPAIPSLNLSMPLEEMATAGDSPFSVSRFLDLPLSSPDHDAMDVEDAELG
ncbi:MAG: hypothetical protein M1838_005264 [Thelocarpon superellum]|nr:MAG: hypothetical protein M1838_005264 [Thelocarpon superellum]